MGDTSPRLVLLRMFAALRHVLSLHSHSYTVMHCIMAIGGGWILVTLKLHKDDGDGASRAFPPPLPVSESLHTKMFQPQSVLTPALLMPSDNSDLRPEALQRIP